MFIKGTMKQKGVDITIKNNPEHFLAPNDWNMVLAARMHKISYEEYKNWYENLIRERWKLRKKEFIDLARQGIDKDVYLKCFCSTSERMCHANFAATYMNNLVKLLKNQRDTEKIPRQEN